MVNGEQEVGVLGGVNDVFVLEPFHLSHRYPLWWAALKENLVIQGHFLAQRLLIEVLTQVCNADIGPATLGGARRAPGHALAPVILQPEQLFHLLP